jgi:FkbM family methyltransferase
MNNLDSGRDMSLIFRKLPPFKGKLKLARFLFAKNIKKAQDIWIKGKYGCTYLLPNLIENVSFDIYVNGIYEQDTIDFLAKRIPANGVFLDLGANIGAISTPLARRRKDIRIVCVEASPWVFSYLEKNLAANGLTDLCKINKALYYTDNEEMDFFSPVEKFGKGSLSPVFTTNAQKVTTIKLDTLIEQLHLPKIDMIKIDVEGYEYHVFKGAEKVLSGNDSPDIFFEFVDWAEERAKDISIGDAQQLLKSWGYRIYYFNENKKIFEEANAVIIKGTFMLYATKKIL